MTTYSALLANRGVAHAKSIDLPTSAPRSNPPTPPSAIPTHAITAIDRRGLMLGSAAAALVATLPTPARAALPAQVGNYLPTAGATHHTHNIAGTRTSLQAWRTLCSLCQTPGKRPQSEPASSTQTTPTSLPCRLPGARGRLPTSRAVATARCATGGM